MTIKLKAAASVAILVLVTATVAHAQAVAVDGKVDAAYGLPKSTVAYDPAAPTSNFGTPGPTTSGEGYSIFLTSDAANVYGFIQGSGVGTSAGSFANVYFDIDQQNGNGSDIGFEVTNNDIFVAGGDGTKQTAGINFSVKGDNIEFSIPNVDFTAPVAGLTYEPGQQFASTGSTVVLRLSQSLGYSVAGGATYGDNRLGSVVIGGSPSSVSAAPEPSSWALMLGGVGILGALLRTQMVRRREEDARPGMIA